MADEDQSQQELERSLRRLQAFTEATSDVVYRMSSDWTEMAQLQGKQFIQTSTGPNRKWIDQYIYPEDQALVRRTIDEAIRERKVFALEHRVRRIDGTVGWTASRAIPILDEAGRILEWFGTASDITLRKQGEAERRLYLTIMSSTPDLVYVFDLQHRFSYANEALLRMWGKTAEESFGKTCLELGYEPWHAAMHDREINQVVATKAPVRGEVPFNGTNGRRIYDYIFVPVIGQDGSVEAVAGTTRDITDMVEARDAVKQHRERLEHQVNERTARLKETIEQMEEFSYSVSHDLRAPVRSMRGYAMTILDDYGEKLGEEGRELLNRIERSGSRMDALIQDLLTYSKLSRQELQLGPVSLDRLVRDVVLQYPELSAAQAEVTVDGHLPEVLGHEPSLTQVLSNLLSNAVKFVAPGVRPSVRLRYERKEGRIRLWVVDNGIGIPPEHRRRLFGMFERMPTAGQYEGTGIGLAIVRKAMERLNGTVGVESDGKTGSQFWIELPAA